MSGTCSLAIDQGTTNTKVVAVDQGGAIVAVATERVAVRFPRPGWVESDPRSVWESVRSAVEGCLSQISAPDIASIGVCNQRESVVAWERSTGEPLGPLISWQCTRGSAVCDSLDTPATRSMISARTGLGLAPMFSASKMRWLLDSIPDGASRAAEGEICLGTVDSWLTWKLTDGHEFGTDLTNASRTLLFNLAELAWDRELLDLFGVPRAALPSIKASAAVHGECRSRDLDPALGGTVIGAILGDSHAALVGHGAFHPGSVKASFGTGTSVIAPTGHVVTSESLSSTVAWSRQSNDAREVCYAIEGNIYATGAALEWTAELLGLGRDIAALETLAMTCADSRGIVLVPAFAGLGAPHWDAHARGLITGLTLGASRAALARATFECVAHQVADIIDVIDDIDVVAATPSADRRLKIHADGGAVRSDLLAQLVADLADVELLRSDDAETAAAGAAHFAGLSAGLWTSLEELTDIPRNVTRLAPAMGGAKRTDARSTWADAIEQSSSRENHRRGTP